jgi:hypothetical protein
MAQGVAGHVVAVTDEFMDVRLEGFAEFGRAESNDSLSDSVFVSSTKICHRVKPVFVDDDIIVEEGQEIAARRLDRFIRRHRFARLSYVENANLCRKSVSR